MMPRNHRRSMAATRVSELLDVLPATLDRSWTTEEMARTVGASSGQLRKDFAREIGVSPMHYLKRVRLAAAKAALRTTDRPLKQVAASVGFNDLSHFVRNYRDEYGHSPSEDRRHHRNGARWKATNRDSRVLANK